MKRLVSAGDRPFPLASAAATGVTVSARAVVDYMRLAGGLAAELVRAERLLIERVGTSVTAGRVALGEGQLVAVVASPRDERDSARAIIVTVYDAGEQSPRTGYTPGAVGNKSKAGRGKGNNTRRMRPYRRALIGGEGAE